MGSPIIRITDGVYAAIGNAWFDSANPSRRQEAWILVEDATTGRLLGRQILKTSYVDADGGTGVGADGAADEVSSAPVDQGVDVHVVNSTRQQTGTSSAKATVDYLPTLRPRATPCMGSPIHIVAGVYKGAGNAWLDAANPSTQHKAWILIEDAAAGRLLCRQILKTSFVQADGGNGVDKWRRNRGGIGLPRAR